MSIENRRVKAFINSAGGTAGPQGKSYRIALPPVWAKELGLSEKSRDVLLQFDGESIVIRRAAKTGYEAFIADARERGHELLILHFYNGDTLCTKIAADRTARRIAAENEVKDLFSTAFGVNEAPGWGDLEAFLEGRCLPRGRDRIGEYLSQLGLDSYDPLEIIRRTAGRMAEDDCWLKIVEG